MTREPESFDRRELFRQGLRWTIGGVATAAAGVAWWRGRNAPPAPALPCNIAGACGGCPQRARCLTAAGGRNLEVGP